MIFKVFVVTFVVVQAVVARSARGNIRYEGYKSSVNHPPAPEIYEAIPVSVVYDEGSSRGDKSIKNGFQTTNKVKSEDKELVTSEPVAEKNLSGKNTSPTEAVTLITSKDILLDSEKHDTTEKPQIASSTPTNGEQQIPVAVIYELDSSYTVDAPPIRTPTKDRVQAKVRKVQRPPIEEKAANNYHISDVLNQEHTQPASEDVKRKSVTVSEKIQEQKPVAEKENQGIHQSGNGEIQSFPKRDNSTRQGEFVPIIQSENILLSHSGNFKYSYEGADGTKAFEHGQLTKFEDDKQGETVSGGFSYTDKDGNEFSLSYTADENGYRPIGAHLPTPPPIPPAIARALAHLATKTTPEPVTVSLSDEI